MQVNRKKNPVTDFTITLHKEYQYGRRSYNACKKQYGGNYERRRNAGSYTYYIRELAVTAEFSRFFKAYFVKVKLCLTSQLAVARHFGADVENCLFKILVFGVVYFKHQFVNRFYQLYTLLFSTFQDYKMYYRKNMLNYTLRILVFNRKVWKTTVFSTCLGENRSETVENSVETV